MMSGLTSVHLILRRGSEGLDCLTELRVESASEVDIKAKPCSDGVLSLELAIGADAGTACRQDGFKQASDKAEVEGLVYNPDRHIVGISQRYDRRLGALGLVGHGNSLAQLVLQPGAAEGGFADVRPSPAVVAQSQADAPSHQPSVTIPRAAA